MPAIIALFGKAVVSFLIKVVMSTASESFIKWLFFYVGELIVKSTKTTQDDVFLSKIKETYEQYDSRKKSD